MVWTSYTHQLWADIRYGMGVSSTSLQHLTQGLVSYDYDLTSSLSVVRTINKECRYLPSTFSGMGLFDITVETTAATLNSFLQYYNMDMAIRITLTRALENLQLELGAPDNPLKYDFSIWGALATHLWIKSLLEKIDAFSIKVHLN